MGIALEHAASRCADLVWGRSSLALSRRAHVVGIVNVTPDSFSDGGRFSSAGDAVDAALRMLEEGADAIDVGGESTRPGAAPVPLDEELRRVVPVVSAIRSRTDAAVSIDTRNAAVARAALDAGADIVNDVSALAHDAAMTGVCARAGAPVVLMHMKGEPRTMQVDPCYDDVLAEVEAFFCDAIDRAVRGGIDRARIVIDPGIGFGKRLEDNLRLVNHLDRFAALGPPVMIGASRKSFIGRVLGGGLQRPDATPVDVHDRLEGTLAVTALAVQRGARLVRVHDVRENVRVVRMVEAIIADGGRS